MHPRNSTTPPPCASMLANHAPSQAAGSSPPRHSRARCCCPSTPAASRPPPRGLHAAACGHRQPRLRRRRAYPREHTKAGVGPVFMSDPLLARSTTHPGSPGAGPIRRCRFPCRRAVTSTLVEGWLGAEQQADRGYCTVEPLSVGCSEAAWLAHACSARRFSVDLWGAGRDRRCRHVVAELCPCAHKSAAA